MKKFLRKLFNRTTLVIFILVVELAAIIALFYVADLFEPEGVLGKKFPNLTWISIIDNLVLFFLLVFQVIIFFRVIFTPPT